MVEQRRDEQRHGEQRPVEDGPDGQSPADNPDEQSFRDRVADEEQRKLRARRRGDRGPWFWLGMFGLVGWSVAIPTVIGVMVGVWLDRRFPGQVSWTLTMLLIGVAAGCWTAWYWIGRESHRG